MRASSEIQGHGGSLKRQWPHVGMCDCIEVVDHHSNWASCFDEEANRIHKACGEAIIAIEHIGSTSIPGLAAKPIIDMMPGLSDSDEGARCVAPMEAMGYEYRGEFGIAGRHFFTLAVDGRRLVNVHMFTMDSAEWMRHLAFRDALRRNETLCREYERLKRELAVKCAHDMERYTDEKTAFIERVEQAAQQLRT